MTQIAAEDYLNKLIYLHADTVISGFDPAITQQEHRARRRLNIAGERKFYPMVSFSGYVSKGSGNYTPKLTVLAQGVRIIPYDTGSGEYNLDILNEILDPYDEVSDRDVFNRLGVVSHVNIDSTYNPVEIVQISGGSGLDPTQDAKLTQLSLDVDDIHKAHFLRRFWDKIAKTITIFEVDKSTPFKVFDADDDLTDIDPQ
jgi:hypothetical protein